MEVDRVVEKTRSISVESELKMPLTRKIKTTPKAWCYEYTSFFELSDFTEEEKLRAVRMCFDDEADTSPGEKLFTLKQDDTAVKYCKYFIALSSNALYLSKNVLDKAFMIGLKARTRARVKMFELRTLKKMMSTTKMVEEWMNPEEVSP
ncbi:unnamed protein product [Cochlearia groenlandica]